MSKDVVNVENDLAERQKRSTVAGMSDSDREAFRLRLVATQAALDPDRRDGSETFIFQRCSKSWGEWTTLLAKIGLSTKSSAYGLSDNARRTSIEDAVDAAFQAGFLSTVTNFQGEDAFQLTPSTKQQVEGDKTCADSVLSDFQSELKRRLDEHDDIRSKRIPGLSEQMLLACVEATAGAYEVARTVDRLSPIELDLQAMTAYLRTNVQPRSVREAMVKIARVLLTPMTTSAMKSCISC
jgi:hypothetical protein